MKNDEGQISSNSPGDSIIAKEADQGKGKMLEDNNSMTETHGKNSLGRTVALALVAIVVIGLLVASGIIPRLRSRKALAAETNELAAPSVLVIQPKSSAPTQEILLPGNIQAFVDAPIYARTNGYLKRWYFDIGSHVKKGQLLADIESPEVDQQLSQAQAEMQTVGERNNRARRSASRAAWVASASTASVSGS